jgi:hypothetical protein
MTIISTITISNATAITNNNSTIKTITTTIKTITTSSNLRVGMTAIVPRSTDTYSARFCMDSNNNNNG